MSEAAVANIQGDDDAPRTRLPTAPGDIVAEKYEVERTLGTGGMGVVVAAVHLDLQERVAIKFMLPEVAIVPAAANRFLREAQATSRLKSEHVARLHDVGKLADGTPFMVMELLEGETLDQLFQRETQVDATLLVDIVLQACEPLDEAHRIGIVHRDVKPENIFLSQRVDEGPIVKVLDFGISKVQSSITITVANGMMGTATYSSPEQLKNASEVGPSADVWSLGVILYEGLTGKLPFGGASYAEICASVLHDEPPRARFHRRDLPEALDDVVLRCVLKDAKDRITSIPELAAALAPFASEEGRALASRIGRRSSKRPDRLGSIPPPSPSQKTPIPFTVTPVPPSREAVVAGAAGGSTMDLERHLLAVPRPLHESGWGMRRVLRSKIAVGLGGFAIVLAMTAVLGGLPGDDAATPAAQAASALPPAAQPKAEPPPVQAEVTVDEPSIPSPPVLAASSSSPSDDSGAPTTSKSARAEKARRVPGPLPSAAILPPGHRAPDSDAPAPGPGSSGTPAAPVETSPAAAPVSPTPAASAPGVTPPAAPPGPSPRSPSGVVPMYN